MEKLKESKFPRKQVVQGEAGGAKRYEGSSQCYFKRHDRDERVYKPGKTVSIHTFGFSAQAELKHSVKIQKGQNNSMIIIKSRWMWGYNMYLHVPNPGLDSSNQKRRKE